MSLVEADPSADTQGRQPTECRWRKRPETGKQIEYCSLASYLPVRRPIKAGDFFMQPTVLARRRGGMLQKPNFFILNQVTKRFPAMLITDDRSVGNTFMPATFRVADTQTRPCLNPIPPELLRSPA